MTGTRARSYDEMVDALAEGLPQLQDTLSGLTPEDWQRPTLLRPPESGKPPWTVLQLAAQGFTEAATASATVSGIRRSAARSGR